MTDTTISTDPATLRRAHELCRKDSIDWCGECQTEACDYLRRHLPDAIRAIDYARARDAAETEAWRSRTSDFAEGSQISIHEAVQWKRRAERAEAENADLARRLAEVTAERDAEIAGSVELLACHNKQFARAETAEAALSRRDEALRVAREALGGLLQIEKARIATGAFRPTQSGQAILDAADAAIAKIDALTKPQEAADAGENG